MPVAAQGPKQEDHGRFYYTLSEYCLIKLTKAFIVTSYLSTGLRSRATHSQVRLALLCLCLYKGLLIEP